MATLNATKKAPILDQDGTHIGNGHAVTSSNPSAAAVSQQGDYLWWVTGVAAGDAEITAVRSLDGATATLPVTVVAATPFAISLGAEVPA